MSPVLVLDSQGLTALTYLTGRGPAILRASSRMAQRIVVPAVVLAEVLTGKAADAAYWRALKGMTVCSTTLSIAARAGELREQAAAARHKKRDLTIDAIVAATAQEFSPAVIVTGDPADLALLTPGAGVKVLGI
jgi:predicted nucleic acid-binding protein